MKMFAKMTICTLLLLANLVLAQIPTNGLVAYYPFNGNSSDESGYGNHGIAKNGVALTSDRFGVTNRAYKFDGVNDYIDCGNASRNITSAITMSFWILFDTDPYSFANNSIIVDKAYSWRFSYEAVAIDPHILYIHQIYSGLWDWDILNTNVSRWQTNKWYHIAAIYDGSYHRIYVDGTQQNSISLSKSLRTSSYPLFIGAQSDGPSSYFKGCIDDVAIYNRALTLSEIQQLYNSSDNTIFSDNFDGQSAGQKPSGWVEIHSGDGNSAITSSQYVSSPNSFRIGCLTSWDGCYNRPVSLSGQTSLIVTLKFKGDAGTWFRPMFDMRVNGKAYSGAYNTNSGKMGWGDNNTSYDGPTTVNKGIWYTIKVIIDVTTGRASYYLNDVLQRSNCQGSTPASNRPGDGIALSSGNGGNGIIYFDDVVISKNTNPTQYTLSLTKAGTGNGQVKVNGTLQNLSYSGAFSSGESVNLEAVPASGSMFSGWSGDLSGSTNPTSITMSSNKNVTLNFSLVVPQPPVLSSPASGSLGVGTSPTLSWNASSGATSYRIQVSTNSGFTSLVIDQSGISGTSYSASGLSNGTTYYWRVNATNAGGTSGWSSTWNFTTGAPPSAPPISLEGPDKAAAGTEFTLDVQVGSAAKPVSNLKIVSFEMLYTNTAQIDYVSYEPATFLTGATTQVIAEDSQGKISASVYRTSGGNSGYGVILRLKFKVLSGAPEGMKIDFTFKEVQANDVNGAVVSLSPIPKTMTVESGVTVWPGDTNNDGRVNIFDINPIVAQYWGKTGPKRPNASTEWKAQLCPPWNPLAATYADCNGDGIINIFDINCVIINFGKTHSLAKTGGAEIIAKEQFLNGTPLILTADKTQIKPGEEFWVSTVVGTAQNPVSRLKIISLEMAYDMTSYVDYVSYELGDFLTGASGQVIPEDAVGKVSTSVYRTSGSNSGYGQVVRFKFKMASNAPINQQVRFDVGQFMANDEDGNMIAMTPYGLTINAPAGVTQYQPIPESFVLHQNFPNPFNPSTQITYELPVRSSVRLAIYDVVGRQVDEYAAVEEAGVHQFTWRPVGAGGIFFCRLEATPLEGDDKPYRSTIKMTFTK